MNRRIAAYALVYVAWSGGAAAQSAQRTVLDGVYGEQQAASGRTTYSNICANCHGDRLSGGVGGGPALSGEDFFEKWDNLSVGSLFLFIKSAMPEDRPGSLSSAQTANAIAYILQFNGFPVGSTPLPNDPDALDVIRMARPR